MACVSLARSSETAPFSLGLSTQCHFITIALDHQICSLVQVAFEVLDFGSEAAILDFFMYVCICVCVCACVCIGVCACVYLSVCVCVLIGGPFGAGPSTIKPASLPC